MSDCLTKIQTKKTPQRGAFFTQSAIMQLL